MPKLKQLMDKNTHQDIIKSFISWLFITGCFAVPVYSQSRIQGNLGIRGTMVNTQSVYPPNTDKQVMPGSFNKRSGSGLETFNKKITNSQNTLSPEVLETLRQLKSNENEIMYQMAEFSPITGNRSSELISPDTRNLPEESTQKELGTEVSYLRLSSDKNINITSLDFRETSVADALRSLAQIININLMLDSNISGQVTVMFTDVTIEEAFNTILTSFKLGFEWKGNILRIFNINEAPLLTKIFPIQHTNATELEPTVKELLTQGRGTCKIDSRTNSLIISDTAAKLAEIKHLLPQLDVTESSVEISSRPLTEVFYLNYADASSLKAPIEMLSSAVKIQEFSSTQASQAAAGGDSSGRMDMMIITDTQNNLNRMRELIEKLDVPPVQVTIDAHIYEIDKNKEAQLGVNWQKAIPVNGGQGNIFDVNISPMGSEAGGTGVFRFGSINVNQFTALLSMLNASTFAKVLSNPVITTLNNRQARITVGQAISYISASQVNAETGNVTNTVGQVNANITLDVTPSVTGNDEVFMDIKPEITSVLGYSTLGGNSTPNLSTRNAETQVICRNNHTIVIGGMIKTDVNETINKVPFFGNLPGIGKFFQSKTNRETRSELIIFITPRIVRSNVSTLDRKPTPRLTLSD
ncbi:type II secretion system protein GspD [bacterium]|nr:type II secretion system protein GspD [bacterium]